MTTKINNTEFNLEAIAEMTFEQFSETFKNCNFNKEHTWDLLTRLAKAHGLIGGGVKKMDVDINELSQPVEIKPKKKNGVKKDSANAE